MSNLTNKRIYEIFCKKNSFNKMFLASMYRPDFVSHILKIKDGQVYFTSKTHKEAKNCIIQQADTLVKTVMTTSMCVDNPSKYKNYDFIGNGLENYFIAY